MNSIKIIVAMLMMLWLSLSSAGSVPDPTPCPPGAICPQPPSVPEHWAFDKSLGKMNDTFKSLTVEIGFVNALQVALGALCKEAQTPADIRTCKDAMAKPKYTQPYVLKYAGGILTVRNRYIVGPSIPGVKKAIDEALARGSEIDLLINDLNIYTRVNQRTCGPANNPGTSGDIACDVIYTSSYQLYQEKPQ